MSQSLERWLFETGLPPHGYCLLWDPTLIATHVISDFVIGVAYFSIPVVLAVLLSRRRDIEFGWMLALFGVFILACGTTHFLSILVLWVPAYGLEGAVKAITAVASIATAIALWPLLPKLIAIPSPAALQRVNDELRREAAERERVEEQLRQSQKMEAIGQLTGGIAHDFNNLLTVVIGNIDRAARTLPADHPARRSLANATTASDRAGVLTHQLLAFARKSPLTIAPQCPNAVVRQMSELLQRAAGDRVQLRQQLASDMREVVADRHQLENALLNLVINSRDAMPAGGEITVSTRVEDEAVVLAVQDSGSGMDAETCRRATEPFFTTKPLGAGTGLGLSQVYGFMQQSGGSLAIASAPGTGTCVELLFPAQVGER